MDIVFRLPEKALEAIQSKSNWSGSITVKIRVDHATDKRIESLQKTLKKKKHKDFNTKSDIEQDVIRLWNQQAEKYQQENPESDKNNPVIHNEITDLLTDLRFCIKKLDIGKLKSSIDNYFQTCYQGESVWMQKDHAFVRFGSFLRSLKRYMRNKKPPWWTSESLPEIKDRNAEITVLIADMFAKAFLGRQKFGLVNPSREYRTCMLAAKRIVKLEGQKAKWKAKWLVEQLIKCIDKSYGDSDKPVYLGSLSSENTWKILFPQHLKDL